MHGYGRLCGIADADEHGRTVLCRVTFATEVLAFHAQVASFDDHAGTVTISGCHSIGWLCLAVATSKFQGDKSVSISMPGFLGLISIPTEIWSVGVDDDDVRTAIFVEIPTHPGTAVGDIVGSGDTGDIKKISSSLVDEELVAFVSAVGMLVKFGAVEIEPLKFGLLLAGGGIDDPLRFIAERLRQGFI